MPIAVTVVAVFSAVAVVRVVAAVAVLLLSQLIVLLLQLFLSTATRGFIVLILTVLEPILALKMSLK